MEILLTSLVKAILNFNWLIGLGVLVAYFIVDAMYAFYTLSVARLNALASANTGALMHFLLALGVLSYVKNFLYIIPITIGSWLGTFYMVNKESKKLTSLKTVSGVIH